MSDPTAAHTYAASFPGDVDTDATCPNCASRSLEIFYAVDNIPVHSCLLMPTREKALAYPTRNLKLGFCPACGFVCNAIFDRAVHEYSTEYEETQAFSPTFNKFETWLAQKLIDTYGIRNKTVLEIGCGKGSFLVQMCQLGDNRGIGVDPAAVPERLTAEQASRVEFIQDFYSTKYSHLTADMICCRHTLEHIDQTQQFMQELRQTIGDNTDTLVFFELPDAMRVLREPAFWDIYYEHCTYFTTGSLARLFRQTGFDVIDLELAYDGQYILLVARPATKPTAPTLALEDDLQQTKQAVEQFPQRCRNNLGRWHDLLINNAAADKRTIIWGGGSKGVSFVTTLGITDQLQYAVDINPYKHDKFMPGTGHEIVAPQRMTDYQPTDVIVMNPIYCDEINHDLVQLGVHATIHPCR